MNALLRLIILIAFAASTMSFLTGCGKAEYDRRLDASITKYANEKEPVDEDDYEEDYDAVDPRDVDNSDEEDTADDEDLDDENSDDEEFDDEDSDDGESPFNNVVE